MQAVLAQDFLLLFGCKPHEINSIIGPRLQNADAATANRSERRVDWAV
jgi:hypothetical protein